MAYKVDDSSAPKRPLSSHDQWMRTMRLLKAERPNFFKRNEFRLITLALITLNVAVFVVEFFLTIAAGAHTRGTYSISVYVLLDMGAMYAPLVQAGEIFRFVTPMFLHMSVMHLAFNMMALYSVGEMLERVLGRWNFLALYFVGGITGNVVSYMASVWMGGTPSVSAGASTSVFALFVAVALLGALHKDKRHIFAERSKSMLMVIGVNVAYTFVMPNVSVSGHLGGALGGLIAMFMVPSKNLNVPLFVRVLVAVCWVAAMALIVGTA